MQPRYQGYSRDGLVWWRLLGSNNRSVARSSRGFPDLDGALADAEEFPDRVARGEAELLSEHGTRWHWVLRCDEQVVAVSATRYGRRLECLRAVARMAALAGSATVADHPLVNRNRLRQRPGTTDALRSEQP